LAQRPVIGNVMDSGLMSLRFAARYLGIFANPVEFPTPTASGCIAARQESLSGAAMTLGLAIRRVAAEWNDLKKGPLPAIACLKDGSFLVVARFTDGKIMVQHPTQGRPQLLGPVEFDKIWTGQLILVKRRTKAARLARMLGLGWLHDLYRRAASQGGDE
jgi:subfamily B ATP-binding cassette protein HlyB/CyaB